MHYYDELARNKLEQPSHYDRMILLLMQENTACTGEEWAADVINRCIRMAKSMGDASTGMCVAIRCPNGKIRLFLEPIGEELRMQGDVLRGRMMERVVPTAPETVRSIHQKVSR